MRKPLRYGILGAVVLSASILSVQPSQAGFFSDAWHKAKSVAGEAAKGFLDTNVKEVKEILKKNGIEIGKKGEPSKPLSQRIREQVEKGTTKFYDHVQKGIGSVAKNVSEGMQRATVSEIGEAID